MSLSESKRRLIARLRRRKTREREGLVLVEGVRSAAEVIRAGSEIRFAACSSRLGRGEPGSELARELEESGATVMRLTDAELRAVSDTQAPQGVLLVVREPSREMTGLIEGGARVLLVDGVQDPGNLGTLIRVAAAFGVGAVIVLDGSVDPWSPKVVRSSAGMCFRVAVAQAPWPEVRSRLREAGVPLLVAASDGMDIARMPRRASWALAIGSEARGVRADVRTAAAASVAVPMSGGVDSLNAGVAGAILLYELTRTGPDA